MKRSNTGTANIKPASINSFPLSAIEICRIIRESARSGVSELHLGDLTLKFCALDQRLKNEANQNSIVSSLAGPPETHSEDADSINTTMSPLDQEAVKAFNETQKLLEDPLSYEEQLIDIDLEDRRREEDDEESEYRGSQ